MGAWVVCGLGWGDESKGSVTDALARKIGARVVARFNGGAQAAHNVVLSDGRHHTFSQFGSGTFAGARTVLTKHMVVDPLALAVEAGKLREKGISEPLSLVAIDQRCLVSTPFHGVMTKIREIARGARRHGSCGVGVGEAVADSVDPRIDQDCLLHAGDLRSYSAIRARVRSLRQAKMEEARKILHSLAFYPPGAGDLFLLLGDEELEERVAVELAAIGYNLRIAGWDEVASELRAGPVIYEGAQGVLLDEWYGFHPHTTWSTTTPDNAIATHVAAEAPDYPRVLGVLRAYHTRHGEGPFPTEARGLPRPKGEHNGDQGQQGRFRVGSLDLVLARYAARAARTVDYLAMTCIDQPGYGVCRSYADKASANVTAIHPVHSHDLARQESLGAYLRGVVPNITNEAVDPGAVAADLGLKLALTSRGPTAADKRWAMVP